MSLDASHALLYIVGAVCLLWITVFLCWVLYQIGKLMKQANEVMDDTRTTVEHIEKIVVGVGDKLGAVSHYLGFIAEGGRQLVSLLHRREKKPKKHSKEEEEEAD